MENLEKRFLEVFNPLYTINKSWSLDNLNLLIKQLFLAGDQQLHDYQSLMPVDSWIEFEDYSEFVESKFLVLCKLWQNYCSGHDYSWRVLDFRRIKKETGFQNVPKQFHHLIELVGMWSISDDILRWDLINCMTNEDKKAIKDSLNSIFDDFETWITQPDPDGNDDVFLFVCYYMIFHEI